MVYVMLLSILYQNIKIQLTDNISYQIIIYFEKKFEKYKYKVLLTKVFAMRAYKTAEKIFLR